MIVSTLFQTIKNETVIPIFCTFWTYNPHSPVALNSCFRTNFPKNSLKQTDRLVGKIQVLVNCNNCHYDKDFCNVHGLMEDATSCVMFKIK